MTKLKKPMTVLAAVFALFAGSSWARHGESHDSRCFKRETVASPKFKSVARVLTSSPISNAPTKLTDGSVAVALNDGNVYHLSEDGAMLGSYNVGSAIESSPVALDRGMIAIGDDSGTLSIINPKEKKNKITRISLGGGAIKATPAAFNTAKRALLIVPTDGGAVHFLDLRTHKVAERFNASSGVLSSPRVLSNETAIVVASDGTVYRFSDKLKVMNERRIDDEFFASPALFANGTLVLPSLHGKVYFLSPELEPLSQAVVGLAAPFYGSPTIIGDHTIALTSLLGEMLFLNADGSIKGRHQTSLDGLFASPVVLHDGTVVVGGSNNGYLYSFDRERGEVNRHLLAPRRSKAGLKAGVRAAATVLGNGNVVVPALDGTIHFLRYKSNATFHERKVEAPCPGATAFDSSSNLIDAPESQHLKIVSGKFGENNDERCYSKEDDFAVEISAAKIFSNSRAAFFDPGPVIAKDGTIVAVTDGGIAHFIKPDGTKLKTSLDAVVMATPLALSNGLVAIGTYAGKIAFYDTEAKLITAHALNGPVDASPELLANSKIGVPTQNGYIHYFDLAGRPLKTSDHYGVFGKGGIAFGGQDTVAFVVGGYNGYMARVSSGKITKHMQFDYNAEFQARPLILKDGSAVFVSKNSGVFIFNAKSKLVRQYTPQGYGDQYLASPVSLVDGTFVIASTNGRVSYVDSLGTAKAELAIDDQIKVSPVVTRKGVVVAAGHFGKIHFMSANGRYLGMHDLNEEVRVPPTVGPNDEIIVATKAGNVWQLNVADKPEGGLRLVTRDCVGRRAPNSVTHPNSVTQKKKTPLRKSQPRK